MTPDYLLHLDFQTIRLFLREADGAWRMIGRAAPDDHGLDETMQAMIGRAQAVHPGPVEAVIALPFDLVFVTKVETDPDLGWVRRDMEIRNALDQSLADPIEELAYDTETDGTLTTAVIVHKQTIEEAGVFAEAHGISPLAYIGMPRDGDGFHRPALFQQTALGAERAGESGVLEIAVPGSAALRSKSIVRESWRRTVEPRADQGSTPDVVDLTEALPDDEPERDLSPEPDHLALELAPGAAAEPEQDDDVTIAAATTEPGASEAPAAAGPPLLPVPDPFEKLAHPFAERPYEPWSEKAMRFAAPLAGVLAVLAVVLGLAYFVLPPSEEAPEVAALPEPTAPVPSPAPEPEPASPPRDPVTDPVGANAPETVIAPAPEPPAPAESAPPARTGLVQPEDPTEPPMLDPLDVADPARSERPAPARPVEGASVGGDRASRDSAEPAALATPLASGGLTERFATASGAPPAPLYDLLVPRIAPDVVREVEQTRPIERPEDLFPTPEEAAAAEREDIVGESEIRPNPRPSTVAPTADAPPEPSETPAQPSEDAPPAPDEDAALQDAELPESLGELAAIRPLPRPFAEEPRGEAASLSPPEAFEPAEITLPPALQNATLLRPAARPGTLDVAAPLAAPEPEPEAAPEPIRVAFTALRPAPRPSNLRRPAPRTAEPQPQTASAPAAPPASRATAPQSTAPRGDLVLLGTTGTSSRRRALVQVPGRGITTVGVGDNLGGGRVAAIDISTLVYTRGGRTIRLDMPR